jgi:flagellar capping protein FliD
MKRWLVAAAALFTVVGTALPAEAIAPKAATGSEKLTITLTSLRNDTTSCGIKLVLSSGTAYSYYSVSVGSPSQGDFSLLTDRRGTISGSFTVLKSILTAGSTSFYLFFNGTSYANTGVAVTTATIKVTNRCPA